MSKSLGNVSNLLDLIDQYDPRAYRMVLLQSHYRSPITITVDTLDAATKSLAGLDAFVARSGNVGDDAAAPDADVIAEFTAAMDDDLDTPRATALLFDTVRRANAALDAGDGVRPGTGGGGAPDRRHVRPRARWRRRGPDDVLDQAAALDAARAAKDFATADAIRAGLQADGWTVETGKSGTTVRR